MTGPRFRPLALLGTVLRPLDPTLCILLAALFGYAWVMMLSASPERIPALRMHMLIAVAVMWVVAAIPIKRLLSMATPLYLLGVLLLVCLILFCDSLMGAN